MYTAGIFWYGLFPKIFIQHRESKKHALPEFREYDNLSIAQCNVHKSYFVVNIATFYSISNCIFITLTLCRYADHKASSECLHTIDMLDHHTLIICDLILQSGNYTKLFVGIVSPCAQFLEVVAPQAIRLSHVAIIPYTLWVEPKRG